MEENVAKVDYNPFQTESADVIIADFKNAMEEEKKRVACYALEQIQRVRALYERRGKEEERKWIKNTKKALGIETRQTWKKYFCGTLFLRLAEGKI